LFPVTEKPNEAINFSGLPVSPNGDFGLYVRWIKGKVFTSKVPCFLSSELSSSQGSAHFR